MPQFAISPHDAERIAAAVTAAEARSDGEIVTVVAAESDRYHDVVAHWSILLVFLGVAAVAAAPGAIVSVLERATGRWGGLATGELLVALLVMMALLFVIGRLLFGLPALRRLLTPRATAARRVRRRATLLFRLAAEHRTRARTGVLLYLSLAEHRAEIVADRSIDEKVDADVWGDAMAALLAGVRDDRAGDGMVAAVDTIGAVLAAHFPRSFDDTNELPDRLILL